MCRIRPPRVIIFDLDGTVADTLEPTFRAFQDAVEPWLGRRPSPEEILERFGPPDHEIVAGWVGPEHAEDAVRRLYAVYDVVFQDAGPFPGVVDLLRELQAEGRRLALCTGRGRVSTDTILDRMDLRPYFETVVYGDSVERPKPAPDGLLKVLQMMGEDPTGAVYVGDTIKDLEAADAAKIGFIAALWGSPEAEDLEKEAPTRARTVGDLRVRLLSPAMPPTP